MTARAPVSRKLIESHLVDGSPEPGEPISIRIDQTLTQDATGTLVWLEFEGMECDHVKTDVSVQYVDHNLIQDDFRNPDDHLFLESACRRFGAWYSRPGNGVSHPVHMERFGVPGATLLGSDSHTPAGGALGMLAIGAGGLEVAQAMAGEPYHLKMPKIWGVELVGKLPDWVSAKDVILEMLRRHDVDGGIGWIIEYHGSGLESLSAMDRHVIANMGAELGATTTVFPSDDQTRLFMKQQCREDEWHRLEADDDAEYDRTEQIDLSKLEPLIACPSSPGNVVPVREVAGKEIYQAYVGSSANPGYRDFAIAAEMVRDRTVASSISFDINPSSRQMLEVLASEGYLGQLIRSGARIHQAGCNGCIGMGQAPASKGISLRTVPRNFPGRSGTADDQVYLCSPETATAAALTGRITDPRELDFDYPRVVEPERVDVNRAMLLKPKEGGDNSVEIRKGPNIKSLPDLEELPDSLELKVLLKVGDDISTDEIMPAGSRVLPYRSNIEAISEFVFGPVDDSYPKRARECESGHCVVGGTNYGQGSSREHAALAPRFLGLRAVIAKEIARIHLQNLINFGVLPLILKDGSDYEQLEQDAVVRLTELHKAVERGEAEIELDGGKKIGATLPLSSRDRELIRAGGVIRYMKQSTEG